MFLSVLRARRLHSDSFGNVSGRRIEQSCRNLQAADSDLLRQLVELISESFQAALFFRLNLECTLGH